MISCGKEWWTYQMTCSGNTEDQERVQKKNIAEQLN